MENGPKLIVLSRLNEMKSEGADSGKVELRQESGSHEVVLPRHEYYGTKFNLKSY
jgi:hypothetical protein